MRTNLRSLARVAISVVFAIYAMSAFGSDQQKAEKRLHRVSAMAMDSIPRAIVNQTMAEAVHAKRIELLRQRHAMNLNYGSLFIAHQLVAAGTPMLDIAVQLESGKNILMIANEHHANWKLIADAAKQLNDKIDDNIYRHYLHMKADQPPEIIDKYDSYLDVVRADDEISPEELASARADYQLWKNRGSSPRGSGLNAQAQSVANDTAEVYKGSQRPHPIP